MPNSKCEKCGLYLDDIIKTKKEKINFATLIHKRLKKFCGIPFKISPYIIHQELIIDGNHNCKDKLCSGNMNYEPFAPNPKNFTEFNFNDLFFNFDLDEFIEKINNN